MAEARRPCWRVSTADQSYERQERDLAAFAARSDVVLVTELSR